MTPLKRALLAGECCSLVGTSGVGKSNFVQFIQQQNVQEHYFPDGKTWIVIIDSNGLVFEEQLGAFEILEAMILRLVSQVKMHYIGEEIETWASELYLHLLDRPSTLLALRTLEWLCERLCNQQELRLIFLFDQFEDIWQVGPPRLFLNLRHLRDLSKYRVVYLVVMRQVLEQQREDYDEVEAFWELFAGHTFGLGMFNDTDAKQMLERVAQRTGIKTMPDDAYVKSLIEPTGGHPGLLRALPWRLLEAPNQPINLEILMQIPTVTAECTKIWLDLEPSERTVVRLIAHEKPIDHPASDELAILRLKEIVKGEPPTLFSPIFTAFVRDQAEKGETGIIVNILRHQVRVDGKPLAESLSHFEFALIELLARHVGEVCKNAAILDALYSEEGAHGNTDPRLDTLLNRLRNATGETLHRERYIIRIRGVGIKLLQGGIED